MRYRLYSSLHIAAVLSLGSSIITTNNTEILITDIGENALEGLPSLSCHTDLTTCCRKRDSGGSGGLGQWTYPNGSLLLNNLNSRDAGEQLYFVRNAPQLIRLARHKRNNPLSPTGSYCCTVPTSAGEVTFCAIIGEYKLRMIFDNLVIISVVCYSLSPLFNGMITYSDSTLGEGTVATYLCNEPFPLIGDSTRTCSSSNSWSGSAPYCQGTSISLFVYIYQYNYI